MDKTKLKTTMDIIFSLIFILLLIALVIPAIIWDSHLKLYTTDTITECNDADGDLIANVTCYETVRCSLILRYMNEAGCKEFIENG
ncbi:MAG: hypothetical protein WC346_04575 [Methanogenium sp.]|jgi:hypothetical protein